MGFNTQQFYFSQTRQQGVHQEPEWPVLDKLLIIGNV